MSTESPEKELLFLRRKMDGVGSVKMDFDAAREIGFVGAIAGLTLKRCFYNMDQSFLPNRFLKGLAGVVVFSSTFLAALGTTGGLITRLIEFDTREQIREIEG